MTALWSDFTVGAFDRFSSCYSKCVDCFWDTQSTVVLQNAIWAWTSQF